MNHRAGTAAIGAGSAGTSNAWPSALLLRATILLGFVLIAGFFILTFFWPLAIIAVRSLENPQDYVTNVTNGTIQIVLWRTIRMGAIVTLGCLILGYPSALAVSKMPPRMQALMLGLILLPALTSFLVRTYGWMTILGASGPVAPLLNYFGVAGNSLIGTFPGLIIAMIHMLLPLMILPVVASMRAIPANQLVAARSLGATPAEAFVRVFLPQSASGAVSGCILVFVVSLGFFVTPALIGGTRETTLAMLIYVYLSELVNWGRATSLAIILLSVVFIILLVSARVTNLWAAFGLSTLSAAPKRRRISGWTAGLTKWVGSVARRIPAWTARLHLSRIFLLITLVVLLLPLLFVVAVSFQSKRLISLPADGLSLRWYWVVLSDSQWIDATTTSVTIAILSTGIALVVGYVMATIVHASSHRLKITLSTLSLGPTILPIIVLAIGIYGVFLRLGWVGSTLALALAHASLAVPYVFINVLNGLAGYNPKLDSAASSLGANDVTRIRRVKIPLLMPAILTAAAFAFLLSMDELIVSLFIAGATIRTLPMVMYGAAVQNLSPELAVVGTLLIVLIVLIASSWAVARRMLSSGAAAPSRENRRVEHA
jgi:putative spermidine/putrescine transport system permease protein